MRGHGLAFTGEALLAAGEYWNDGSTLQQEQPKVAKSTLTVTLTKALLKPVQNSEIKLSIEKKLFNCMDTGAGRLLLEIQVIPVRTTAKYRIDTQSDR